MMCLFSVSFLKVFIEINNKLLPCLHPKYLIPDIVALVIINKPIQLS